jgi:hypothetical protein
MAMPPLRVVKWGHFIGFERDWNYPQCRGTGPPRAAGNVCPSTLLSLSYIIAAHHEISATLREEGFLGLMFLSLSLWERVRVRDGWGYCLRPLTPTLSRWEREQDIKVSVVSAKTLPL